MQASGAAGAAGRCSRVRGVTRWLPCASSTLTATWLEVNTTTGALAQRSMVVSTAILNGDTPGLYNRFDIANERSLQVGNLAYQLSGGQVFDKVGD